MKKLLTIFTFLLGIILSAQTAEKPYVLLISFDGLRWDLPAKFQMKNLEKFGAEGVKAKFLKPSYPSKTFPNHYSIVTGLYPDHHGIINNKFIDPKTQKAFALNIDAKFDGSFYGGNPIWNLSKEQGVKSASFFWPGSDTGTKSPNIFKPYDEKVTFTQRVDSVVSWFRLPEAQRPHLVTLYFDEPDETEHEYGPVSAENQKNLEKIDAFIGEMLQKIKALPMADKLNIIIVSDHGMADIDNEKKVPLMEYLKPEWLGYAQVINPIMSVQAKAGYKDSIKMALKKVPNIKYWETPNLPKRLHFGTNPRALDFVIEANPHYSLVKTKEDKVKGGTHGYDNKLSDMHAIFYAQGPQFKQHKKYKSFENVNIYPLIAKILGLQITEPIDGKLKPVKRLLR